MCPTYRNAWTCAFVPMLVIVATTSAAGCSRLASLGHPAAESRDADEPKMASDTVTAEKLELFMEHPYLAQGQPAKFNVHLTVLKDGSPIRSGKLTVVATGPSGKTAKTEQPAPKSPGIFGPVLALPEAGENELQVTLDSEQAAETIRVAVTVFVDESAAKKAADESDEAEPEGAVAFLKEQQWKIGLVTEPAGTRRMVARMTVPGQVVPAAGAKAVVSPPLAGRVVPPSGGNFPRVGQHVQAGQVVAVIEPPLAGPQGVELLVNRAQIQAIETELAAKQLDVEIEINRAKIELDFARGVLKRAEELSARGAVATKQYEEARNQVNLAEANHEGKQRLREPYEQARRQLQSLLRSSSGRESVSPDSRTKPPLPGLQFELRSPVSGTITAAQVTEGEFVDATKPLFTVINLDDVWIEAKVSEYDLERVAQAPAATFLPTAIKADGQRPVDDRTSRPTGKLIDVGKVIDPLSRTVPVRYEVPNTAGELLIGMFVNVAIETARTEETLAIPESALVDEDGRPTVYVLLDGESFQKRDLELGIRDSGYVQVRQGLKGGERVVTQGGYAIRLASVSAVIPAHGHTH